MSSRWKIFQLCGIPVFIHVSWLIIIVLLTWLMANSFPALLHVYFPSAQELPQYEYWIMGLAAALGFFACILLHEFGHAIVAQSIGIPINGITLFLFGGVAELSEEPTSASGEFLMAIAGPVVSAVLFIGLMFMTSIGYHNSWPHEIVIVSGYLAFINIVILLFNMVPAFPLDGGRVFRSILWGMTGNLLFATKLASLFGQTFAWLLISLGIVQILWGYWIDGVWSCLIGWFLYNAAYVTYQNMLTKQEKVKEDQVKD